MNYFSGDINVDLPRLTPEQSGIYTCVVENSIGKVNQSISLDVQCEFIDRNLSNKHRLSLMQMLHVFVQLTLESLSIVQIQQFFVVMSIPILYLMKSSG